MASDHESSNHETPETPPEVRLRLRGGAGDMAPSPGPLPGDVEPALRRLDGKLGEMARRSQTPTGLAARVFARSARLLPARSIAAPSAAPVRPRRRSWSIAAVASRVALAASLALAIVVAARFMQPAAPPVAQTAVADLGFLQVEPLAEIDAEFAHLLETGTLTFDELRGELTAAFALGM